MAGVQNPRGYLGVSRALLIPALRGESFAQLAVEGIANGIPFLASDRGALPETLGESGFVYTISERLTEADLAMPLAREVPPWVAVIERLWDDADFEARHRALARAEAQRWGPATVAARFKDFFASLLR
jgi:glycosyltransferase involved in cell wall biosynthesis